MSNAPLKETPTLTASGKVVGRPRRQPPKDLAKKVSALAERGASMRGVANGLGVSRTVMERWFEEHPDLNEAFQQGREKERQFLHTKLYDMAAGGNMVAAMFLLKTRHGYVEGDQSQTGNRTNITITLPAAQPLSSFTTIENEPNTRTERISDATVVTTRRG